jgi:hypothetical protein
MFLRPFGLYCSACFGNLFVSILCTCCSHFFWYCFISFTMLCAPVFSLIHGFFSLSNFVIPSKCLRQAGNLSRGQQTILLKSSKGTSGPTLNVLLLSKLKITEDKFFNNQVQHVSDKVFMSKIKSKCVTILQKFLFYVYDFLLCL